MMKFSVALPRTASRQEWICASCRRAFNSSSTLQPKLQKRIKFKDASYQGTNRVTNGKILYHTSRVLYNTATPSPQAVPLGDFYTDLLSKPIPKSSKAQPSLPTFVQSGDKSKEEKAKLLFGSIEGSGYERRTYERPDATWRTINGVPIPPKPVEPENCCMSGCVHCVWDDYRDDVEGWAARIHEAQAKVQHGGGRASPKVTLPRAELSEASSSMDDDGGGSEALWTAPSNAQNQEDLLFQGIPIGIREFMATEKRIRDRKKARKEKRK